LRQFLLIAHGLWKAYLECDATLAEINPLVITGDNALVALDGKMLIDDNALFRQPVLADMRDLDVEAPSEVGAPLWPVVHQAGWQYRLHGQRAGDDHDGYHQTSGFPAFLDIGGRQKVLWPWHHPV
jgi:hypothetical protein